MVNAFWLDRDLQRAAAWLVDAHVTSSVFECSMVLTTAVQLNGHPDTGDLYFTHATNPLTRWAATSHANWRRLYEYTEVTHDEWRYRWDHDADERHACWATVESLDSTAVAGLDWPASGLDDPPQLTGDWSAPDYVDAYRYYYANEKGHLFEWSRARAEPQWLDEYTVDAPEDAGATQTGAGAADETE